MGDNYNVCTGLVAIFLKLYSNCYIEGVPICCRDLEVSRSERDICRKVTGGSRRNWKA